MFSWNNVLLKFNLPCATAVHGEGRKNMGGREVFLKFPSALGLFGEEENEVVKL